MGSAMRRSTAQFLAAEAGAIALPPTFTEFNLGGQSAAAQSPRGISAALGP